MRWSAYLIIFFIRWLHVILFSLIFSFYFCFCSFFGHFSLNMSVLWLLSLLLLSQQLWPFSYFHFHMPEHLKMLFVFHVPHTWRMIFLISNKFFTLFACHFLRWCLFGTHSQMPNAYENSFLIIPACVSYMWNEFILLEGFFTSSNWYLSSFWKCLLHF